jgi:hypothetical protein
VEIPSHITKITEREKIKKGHLKEREAASRKSK